MAKTIKEGLIVGVIGYASVALLYAIFDFFAARGLFYTVDLLGKALFRGLRDPAVLAAPIELDMMAIFWYNLLHLFVSLIIGFIIIGLIELTERQPARAQRILFVLIMGFVITVVVVGFLTSPIRPILPWWSIVVANLIAVFLASVYLRKKHPGIGPHLIYWLSKIMLFPFKNKPSS